MQEAEDNSVEQREGLNHAHAAVEPANVSAGSDPLTFNLAHLALSTPQTPTHCESQELSKQSIPLPTSRNHSPSLRRQPSQSRLQRSPKSPSVQSSDRVISPSLHKKASYNALRDSKTPPRSPVGRRTSSYASSTVSTSRPNVAPPTWEAPKLSCSAADVARDYFRLELTESHESLPAKPDARTVVIVQDDCYGHRFSRPRTSKSNLSTIVERPERLQASLKGVAVAYVRLGGRHADGSNPPSPTRAPSLLPSKPFSICKSPRRVALESASITSVHGVNWMRELKIMCETAESKLISNGKELSRPNLPGSIGDNSDTQKPNSHLHEGDLYLCSESLPALEGSIGGVCEAVDKVFDDGPCERAFVSIRPPGHHCSADLPSGFCWLNNVHIGISYAAATQGLTHAAIIDFDLHHGDGSQAITWAHNCRVSALPKNAPHCRKTSIGYFSLHDINSYPCEMGDEEKVRNASLCIENAHGQSIWNVHLQSWKSEAEFWRLYEERYSQVLDKARGFLRNQSDRIRNLRTDHQPKAAIFLSAGFDASEWESPFMQRHKVNVPTSFYARFTQDVVNMAHEKDLAVDGRVISILEGGYSDRALTSGVFSHLCGLTGESEVQSKFDTNINGSVQAQERSGYQSLNNLDSRMNLVPYNPQWWSAASLDDLEGPTQPKGAADSSKRMRNEVKPTYSTATESYRAKIVSPPVERRSLSSHKPFQHNVPYTGPRQPTPPPPEVDWVTATSELCKLLVPTDRQTRSCRPEELNAEATRARRDRQSGEATDNDTKSADLPRMQLREKRAKQTTNGPHEASEPLTRASRRRTIADVKLLSEHEGSAALAEQAPSNLSRRPTRRRSSAASSVTSIATDLGSETTMPQILESQKPLAPADGKKSRPLVSRRHQPPKSRVNQKAGTAESIDHGPIKKSNVGEQTVEQITTAKAEGLSKETDVDQLASGVKKMSLKLNIPPKDEYDARHTASKETMDAKPGKTSTKSVRPNAPKKSKSKNAGPTETSRVLVKDTLMEPGGFTHRDERPEILPKMSRMSSDSPYHTGAQPPKQIATSNSESQTLDSSPSSRQVDSQTLEKTDSLDRSLWTSSPAPQSGPTTPITVQRTRSELPVFTANSTIAFSPRIAAHGPVNVGANGSVAGDEPLAPRSSNGQSQAPLAIKSSTIPKSPTGNKKSIWDVPDSPQLRRQGTR